MDANTRECTIETIARYARSAGDACLEAKHKSYEKRSTKRRAA